MIYALVLGLQEPLITKHCYGDCGHAIWTVIGGIDGGYGLGSLVPCRTDNCPYQDKVSDPIGEVQGEAVCLRKLREP